MPWHSRAALYVVAVVASAGATFAASRLRLPAFVFEHLMVVLVVVLATVGGRWPAIAAALVGGLFDNVLLREPVGRPAITGVRDAVDLGLLLRLRPGCCRSNHEW